jgi:transposase InsO family protein
MKLREALSQHRITGTRVIFAFTEIGQSDWRRRQTGTGDDHAVGENFQHDFVPGISYWAVSDSVDQSFPHCLDGIFIQPEAIEANDAHRTPGLLHHSDRGVQYASQTYRQALAQAGAVCSMNRRANCYDNAAMESFWSALKRELVHRRHFATRTEAHAAIFDWIEVFYNRVRFHSALGDQSPVDFENQINKNHVSCAPQ